MRIQPTILALAVLLVAGCGKPCIKGEGPTETRTIPVAEFTELTTEGAIDVTVEKGEVFTVTATAQSNLLDLLNTEVTGNEWRIGTSQCWKSSQGFTVHIVTPHAMTSLNSRGSGDLAAVDAFDPGTITVSSQGSGNMALEGLSCKKLSISAMGSGDMTLRGTCATIDGNFKGSGNLQARDLAANEVILKLTGSGNATVTAISKLNVKLTGSGNVHYAGNPDVKSKVTGSGAVIPAK